MTPPELHACRSVVVNFPRCKRLATPAPRVPAVRHFSWGISTHRANSRQLPCGTMRFVQIVVLAGGVGGARFLRGLKAAVPGSGITAIVNTGDDVTLHGLRICPDLDTVVYTLGGGIDEERGWGRAEETWTVNEELAGYGAEPTWFGLGDRDLATHLVRTRMLDAGYPLSQVTAALATRWQPGVTVLPMSDQRVETHVVVADPERDGRQQAIHFQEWWVRYRASLTPSAFVQVGVDAAHPAPGM